MTARRRIALILINALAILLLAFAVSPLFAQQAAQDDIENAKFQATGAINSNAVYIRSGPSENDYPTMRLDKLSSDKPTEVTVIGERFNWLKILPPEGSFCYVAKAYVNRTGNGSFGQVTTTLNVRVGSSLNPLKTKVAAKLEPNERVEIIGEQDEYFKIKPPADVYLYVNKQFVDFVKVNEPGAVAVGGNAGKPAMGGDPQTKPSEQPIASNAPEKPSNAIAEAPATQPATKPSEQTAATNPPTTEPTADAETEFEQLEKTYSEITQRPLDEQPVETLLAGYQKLAAGGNLPESLRRICDFKVGVLKARAELKAQFAEVRKAQDDMKSKQMTLKAEQQELQQRIDSSQVQVFTAVGTLRTSSLQIGQQTLYRLTDPANGRTVVYIRSDDQKLGQYIGKFIGVKGELVSDQAQNLKFVAPSSYSEVDPAKIGQSIITQLAPPSLLPGGDATASTGNQ